MCVVLLCYVVLWYCVVIMLYCVVVPLTSCTKLEKTNEPILRRLCYVRQADGWGLVYRIPPA